MTSGNSGRFLPRCSPVLLATLVVTSLAIAEENELPFGGLPETSPGANTKLNVESHVREKIREKLSTIVIPRLDFSNVTLREALQFLQNESLRLDPAKSENRGINLVLQLGGVAPEYPAPDLAQIKINLNLENVSLGEALKYVVELAGLTYHIEPYAVIITYLEHHDTLMTKEYRVPAGLLSLDGAKTTAEQLEKKGVQFPVGASAVYIPNGHRLIVRNTETNLDLIAALIETDISPEQIEADKKEAQEAQNRTLEQLRKTPFLYFRDAGVPFPSGAIAEYNPATNQLAVRNTKANLGLIDALLESVAPEITEFSSTGDNTERIRQKLSTIVIPHLNLINAPVVEAVQFLQTESIRLDPEHKGVSISLHLKVPGVPVPQDHKPAPMRLNLQLTNVPLKEALHYVTELAGVKFKVEPFGVKIVPMTTASDDSLILKEYVLPPLK